MRKCDRQQTTEYGKQTAEEGTNGSAVERMGTIRG